MIRVYLCDDHPLILEKYKEIIINFAHTQNMDVSINTFLSGEQLLFFYEDIREEPDIIFLDILMDGENGLEIAKKLRHYHCHAEIVFLNSNPEYVFDSFEVSPAGYLLKNDTSQLRLHEVLTRIFHAAIKKATTLFSCENGTIKQNIPITSILYFEVTNRMVSVHYDDQIFTFYSTLEHVLKKLDSPVFCRVHRSFLVNFLHVKQMDGTLLTLTNHETIPIGVTYLKKVKESLNHYYSQI